MSYCIRVEQKQRSVGSYTACPLLPHCGLNTSSLSTMLASLSHLNLFSPTGRCYRLITTFNNNLRGVNSLNFSKDGHYLASGGEYIDRFHPKTLRSLTQTRGRRSQDMGFADQIDCPHSAAP